MNGLNHRFPKKNRLLTRHEYRRVSYYGKRFTGRYVIIDVLSVAETSRKLGITVTKKFGKAVHRNHFKRMMREAFRLHLSELPSDIWLIARPRRFALKANSCQIAEDMLSLLHENSANIPSYKS